MIHSAGGGVGLAAVQLAQAAGAVVYAAVSRPEKRHVLESMGVRYIYDSRDIDCYEAIREAHPQGLDIVLNTQVGPAAVKSEALLRDPGYFLDLTKQFQAKDGRTNGSTSDLSVVNREQPERMRGMLLAIKQASEANTLKPLPYHPTVCTRQRTPPMPWQ